MLTIGAYLDAYPCDVIAVQSDIMGAETYRIATLSSGSAQRSSASSQPIVGIENFPEIAAHAKKLKNCKNQHLSKLQKCIFCNFLLALDGTNITYLFDYMNEILKAKPKHPAWFALPH